MIHLYIDDLGVKMHRITKEDDIRSLLTLGTKP